MPTILDEQFDDALKQLEYGVEEYWNYRTGFFTPYRSASDFAATLVSPVVEPIVDSIAFLAVSAISLTSLAASGAMLLVTSVCAVSGETDLIATGLALSALALLAAAITAAVALLALFATVVSIPANCISIVTRSFATVADALCCDEPVEDDSEYNYY